MRSPHDDRVMQMVRAGLGVTVAPRSLERPGIAMVPLDGFDATRRIGLVFGPHWAAQYGPEHDICHAFGP